jgi:PIN domain nuclease of toxin-antitoxin system
MRGLIDSQSLIWYVDQDHLLTPAARAAISDPANNLLLSAATIWEIGIKVGLGKLSLSLPYRLWMDQVITDLSLAVLPITVEYTDAQARLPAHHRDPFDRLLAAQALTDGLAVVSADAILDKYGIRRIW